MTPTREYPFWTYRDLILFFALGMPCIVAGQLLITAFVAALHLHVAGKGLILVPAQFLGYLFLFLALWSIFRIHYGRPFWPSLAWAPARIASTTLFLGGVLLAFIISALGALIRTPNIETPMTDMLSDRRTAVLIAIFAVTLGPVCEELAFRGFMQPLLVRSLGAPAGILLTAIPFGLLHLAQNAFSWRHGLLITLAGAAFGYVRHVTGSTRASATMHAGYNAVLFVALFSPGYRLPGAH